MKDYYEILEVNKKASKDTINKVFKLLMKANHPDLFQGEEKTKAEEKCKEYTEAYTVLNDDAARAKYDEELAESEKTGGNASMLQTIKEENDYLKQVIAQKNDYIARLTGNYENQQTGYYQQNNQYTNNGYADEYEEGPTFGHNANQQNYNPYAGMTQEQINELNRKEKMSYFFAKLRGMGSDIFILIILGIILLVSLFSSLKNLTSFFGK